MAVTDSRLCVARVLPRVLSCSLCTAACRSHKIFCDRSFPCGRCAKLGLECAIPSTVRLGRPKAANSAEKKLAKEQAAAKRKEEKQLKEKAAAEAKDPPRHAALSSAAAMSLIASNLWAPTQQRAPTISNASSTHSGASPAANVVEALATWSVDQPSRSISRTSSSAPSLPSSQSTEGAGLSEAQSPEEPSARMPELPVGLPPSPPTSPPEQMSSWVAIRPFSPTRSTQLLHALLASFVAAVAFVAFYGVHELCFTRLAGIFAGPMKPQEGLGGVEAEPPSQPPYELPTGPPPLPVSTAIDHVLLALQSYPKVVWAIGLNLPPLPYLLIWAILCPESPKRRTPTLTACQVLIVLWTLARVLGAMPFLESLEQYGLSPEVHAVQVMVFYSVCGVNLLRLVSTCLFIETLWTVNRLMHVGNACIAALAIARLWWLGVPTDAIWLLHPDISVGEATFCCLCQLGYAMSFHPAFRQRLSKAFRSYCGVIVKGDHVPIVAYVGCAACAALVAVIYRTHVQRAESGVL